MLLYENDIYSETRTDEELVLKVSAADIQINAIKCSNVCEKHTPVY